MTALRMPVRQAPAAVLMPYFAIEGGTSASSPSRRVASAPWDLGVNSKDGVPRRLESALGGKDVLMPM